MSDSHQLNETLKVVHLGRLCKRSSEGLTDSTQHEYHSRWSVLAYGIFCYFTNCEKAKQFLESLPSSNQNSEITRDQHRMAFKTCIKTHQPRGYMKILDRNGNPVSSLLVDEINHRITITHKERQFGLKMDTTSSFRSWLKAFSALKVEIIYSTKKQPKDMKEQNENKDKNQEMKSNQEEIVSIKKDKENQQQQQQQMNVDAADENEENIDSVNYDEEDERLLAESQRLEQLLKKDQKNILKSFQDIRKSIAKTDGQT